ncbi:hypothetical protein HDV01_006337 [Terramyces sp. JEL0728]|nr:hypothetical protein HDV01_006337 [Terramyces sp. JEL0728]
MENQDENEIRILRLDPPDAATLVGFRTLTTYNDRDLIRDSNDSHKPEPIKAHLLRDSDLCIAYSTDISNGLEKSVLDRKVHFHGQNKLSPPKTNYLLKFLGYTFGGFNAMMWLAAIISFISYKPLGGDDPPVFALGVGLLLILVIFVSTMFYASVDYHASKIMQSIQNMVAQKALVIRCGIQLEIDALDLVPGDVVLLSMGQRVPADIRLVEVSSDLLFDRSLLTGESKLINGTTSPTDENALESKNLALSSTFVVRGKAKGVVFQTGDKTIIGQIVQMSGKQKNAATPIQKELNTFTIIISTLAFTFFIVSILAWVCWIRTSYPLYETAATAMVNALGCLTAFVPQGLPVCFALALTIIAKRMSDRNVLVKNLSTIETLGCMSVLCSDKTGTLTMGKMQVCGVMFVDQSIPEDDSDSGAERAARLEKFPGFKMVANFSSICCDATFLPGNENLPIKDRPVNGDLTDSAILRFSEAYQQHIFDVKPKVLFSLAFNSKNKFMAKVVSYENGEVELLIKGAPDILIPSCTSANSSDGESQDTSKVASIVNDHQRKASSNGFRVLALCKKSLKGVSLPLGDPDEFEKLIINEIKGLALVGMLTIRDPPRKETLPTVSAMKKAGIRVFMVTGDFELTAFSIAKQVGIITTETAYSVDDLPKLKKEFPLSPDLKLFDFRPQPQDPIRSIVLNGKDVPNLTQEDWDFIARFFSEMVFARTTPEQKLLIVEHLKCRGDNIVAVTGDGTNDAPALKAADIGVAMGNGTDVAKEAAAMILLDSDFSSLLVGIENGRLVFENLKKVIMYLMPGGSYGELMAIISTVFFGMQIPMTAFQQVVFCVFNDVLIVPADIRLVEVSSDLLFDRSLLTGESKLINGTTSPTDENALESKNLALSSTFVVRGKAKGVVFQTGDKTIIGQIVQMSGKQKNAATPIQKELNTFTIIISTLAFTFFIVSILAWVCWIRTSYPLYETAATAMVNALGCLTAFVPQGLPVCFALALTIIAKRMSDRNVLVKNLSTIETLGCMSVLCSDKTGTLTMGKMQVCGVMFVDQSIPEDDSDSGAERAARLEKFPGFKMVANFSSICCDATFLPGNENLPIKDRPVNGDLTDSAILRFSEAYQQHIFDVKPKVLFSLAFNSKNKFMAKVVAYEDGEVEMLIKGAPDILMPSCTSANSSDGESQDTSKVASIVNDHQRKASSNGFRVLALCKKSLKGVSLPLGDPDEFEKLIINEIKGLALVGMLTIRDPPRKETLPTVSAMKKAGIRVFMVTGDFELTAFSIAKQVGIITTETAYSVEDLPKLKKDHPLSPNLKNFDYRPQPGDPVHAIVFNGKDLASISEEDWDFIARFFSEMVFARTTPEQKLLIVEHLKCRGDNIVAVTGDGTNDAPALKAADIGVAMGNGTDVAKEAAAMILLDSDFSSLLVGIENGRLVFENLKKVIMYLMPAGSYGELMATISTVFFGMQAPMTAFQQVLFCVTNDVFMSISLMYETAESNLMNKPPRNARTDHLADWKFFLQIYFFIGAMVWVSAMGMWFLFMSENGLSFYDLMFVYDKWQDGWAGKSLDDLNNFVYIGEGVYYVTLAICQFGTLFAVRNRTSSILESNPLWGPRQNLVIPISMAGSVLICILSLYLPFIQTTFYTASIPAKYWGIPFLLAIGIILMDEIRKALVAYDAGINFFDTAEVYAAGESERVIGEAIKKYKWPRSSLVISTKLYWAGSGPNDRGLSRKHIAEGLRASLKRLQLDYVDLYSNGGYLLINQETIKDLHSTGGQANGGTSSLKSAEQLMDAHRVAERLGLVGPLMEQPQYNMFHRERFELEYAPLYKKFGLGTTIWSPLASGVLTGKYLDGIPPDSRLGIKNDAMMARMRKNLVESDEGKLKQGKVRSLLAIAKELDCTLAQLALAWCLKNKNVSSVITGASRPSQVKENLASLTVVGKLSDEIMKKIDDILENKPELPPARF